MMQNLLKNLYRDERGMAAEFALVVPLLLLLLLGTIDVGIYSWTINRAEKSTQIGARWAAVTTPVASDMLSASYENTVVGSDVILQGDRIPREALGTLTCTNTACTCTTGPCPGTSHDEIAFGIMADRMRMIMPSIQDANVVVNYSGSGLGFAGNPNGPDIAPLITVRLVGMTYNSVLLSPIGGSVGMPDFAYSITAEDSDGTTSN